jgi:DNA-binding MarR family transcriptional regulator
MVEQNDSKGAAGEDLDFGILLGLAYQSFTDRLRASLTRQGFDDLGGAYGYVFRALAEERLSQRELAGRLGITDQGMAKIVAEMVERRYVERGQDPEDSRVKRLRLAPRGKGALAAARRFHAGFERELAAELGEAAVRKLRQLLQIIAGRGAEQGVAHARLRPM